MIRNLLAAAAAMLCLAGGAAQAQERPVVVELYTSQGCSSCPPADALLKKLAARDGVIALALHVDYWDYIGWKDTFGDPAFSARQRAYARKAGRRMVYTPQMIVDGQGHIVGNKPMEVLDQIEAARRAAPPLRLEVTRRGQSLRIAARADGRLSDDDLAGGLVVQLVRYTPSQTVRIGRGENAGRTIEYVNIVTDWQQVGRWDGRDALQMTVPIRGEAPAVVILQQAGPGRILAAAEVN